MYTTNKQHKIAFQSKADHHRMCVLNYAYTSRFCFCNFDLHLMILKYEYDVDITQDVQARQK